MRSRSRIPGRQFIPSACAIAVTMALLNAALAGRPGAGIPFAPSTDVIPLIAQTGDPVEQTAPSPPEKVPLSPEEKQKARSAIVLLYVVAGIAVTGLLLLIVAVSVRGLQRKLAGPVRFDPQPHDLLPDAASPSGEAHQPDEQPEEDGGAADETQHT